MKDFCPNCQKQSAFDDMMPQVKVSDENPAQPVVGELALGADFGEPNPLIETQIRKQIWDMTAYMPHVKLYRNAVGKARRGKCVIPYGLKVGSADMIGWKTITITEEMKGKKVAVFLSIELKTEKGPIRQNQIEWMDLVLAAGGIAGVARSAEEARELLQ